MEMPVNEIIKNLTYSETDDAIVKSEFLNHDKAFFDLPLYLRETISYLEDMMLTNTTFFNHILLKLKANNYHWSIEETEIGKVYHISTKKGKIILM